MIFNYLRKIQNHR